MSTSILDPTMTEIGYFFLLLLIVLLITSLYKYIRAAISYYSNFNSDDVGSLRKIILDAELKIKLIQRREKR